MRTAQMWRRLRPANRQPTAPYNPLEFAIGLVVIGITAALVLSPPGAAAAAGVTRGDTMSEPPYHYIV